MFLLLVQTIYAGKVGATLEVPGKSGSASINRGTHDISESGCFLQTGVLSQ